MTEVRFDRATHRWDVGTDRGDRVSARYCVMATGCLSTARMPDFPGIERFTGKTYHTGHWPHEGVDFTGQRVGVIGTGSSAIQAIPVIAQQAAQLTVFQRTPNFSIPSRNGPMSEAYAQTWKADYPALREKARHMRTGILNNPNDVSALEVSDQERRRIYEERWAAGGTNFMAAFNDLIIEPPGQRHRCRFRARQDPRDGAQSGSGRAAGAEEPSDRHQAHLRRYRLLRHVQPTTTSRWLMSRTTPITEITANGVRARRAEYAFDAIVFATGFDAMTGALLSIDIEVDGRTLREKWEAGPRTYLGLMTAGFPNMFMITGPGSPSVLSNMMVSIEQHVDWIADCVAYLRSHGLDCIEATQAAEDAWVAHGNEVANRTLYPLANSWYMGVNIPGKPQVFMPYIGGVGSYRQICDEIAAEGYRGFVLSAQSAAMAAE